MLVDAALSFCNHVLTQEDWAREQLKSFAGQTARLTTGALSFSVTVTPLGFFKPAQATAQPEVTVSVPGDSLWQLSQGREALLSVARIEGRADFADTLSFVLRHLRWDLEADLAPHCGDLLAHRIVSGVNAAIAAQRQCFTNLSSNLADYLRDESRDLLSTSEMRQLRSGIIDAESSTELLERRINRFAS